MYRLSLAALLFFFQTSVFSQSIEEGKKFIYYERYLSAKQVFEKILQSKPNQPEAAYWLAQAYIGLEDFTSAKNTLQVALNANLNDPLLLSGMGEIELLNTRKEVARTLFETALSASKEKDLEVLHAIGRANVNAKDGDANYAIAQLQKATNLKKFNDATVYVTLGDAYRKLLDGGNAVVAYQTALGMNPQLAAAVYKEGLIYKSQKNKEIYLPKFESAIQMDPQYGPAYYSLYVHWYERDVAKAEDFLNKYIERIDPDSQNDYYRIDLLYASKKFQEAIQGAEQLIAQLGPRVKPRIYRLKAYSYKSLSDFTNAKLAADAFFSKANPSDWIPKDYELYGDILAAIPNERAGAYAYYEMAITADSISENKVAYLQKAVELAKSQKDKKATAYWANLQYQNKKNPSNLDLFNVGKAYMDAASEDFSYYAKADTLFALYTEKFPTQYNGYYWRARVNWSIDSTMALSLANPYFEKVIELTTPMMSTKDSATVKNPLKLAHRYFIGFYNAKKENKVALEYCDKYLAIDPNDSEFKEFRQLLSGNKPAADKPKKP
ncbi:MAG: tetratricopeptide repeat protein [Bacteroidetes bacterium]|nr:tetratricopeptide repeat protein [Bacteroidota bacterium]